MDRQKGCKSAVARGWWMGQKSAGSVLKKREKQSPTRDDAKSARLGSPANELDRKWGEEGIKPAKGKLRDSKIC